MLCTIMLVGSISSKPPMTLMIVNALLSIKVAVVVKCLVATTGISSYTVALPTAMVLRCGLSVLDRPHNLLLVVISQPCRNHAWGETVENCNKSSDTVSLIAWLEVV